MLGAIAVSTNASIYLYTSRQRHTPCNVDVGGGSVSNDTKPNLARIPLRWMIRECFKAKTGIMFDVDLLRGIGLEPNSLWPVVLSRPPPLPVTPSHFIQKIPDNASKSKLEKEMSLPNYSAGAVTGTAPTNPFRTEEEFELDDALSPIYDQLSLNWSWWILEWLPIIKKYKKKNNSWASWLVWKLKWPHWGRGRNIKKQVLRGVKVHRSVKMRMEAKYENQKDGKYGKYIPQASFDERYTTWID